MGIIDNVGESINKKINDVGKALENNQLKMDARELEEKSDRLASAIGYKIFNKYSKGEETSTEIAEMCSEIEVLKREIDELNIQIIENERKANNMVLICQNCGEQVSIDTKFCYKCGAKLASEYVHCESCGKEVVSGNKFCTFCGANMETQKSE